MTSTAQTHPPFQQGDEVVLTHGVYEGTPGAFLRLREDPNWADITERNGSIRSHPVVWLAHSKARDPMSGVNEAAYEGMQPIVADRK